MIGRQEEVNCHIERESSKPIPTATHFLQQGQIIPTKPHLLLVPDVGCPSVCYKYVLLPLVNKEAALAYSRAEYSQAGRDIERVGGVKEMTCSC